MMERERAMGAAEGRLPRLVGGVLCLDFTNSVGGRGAPLDEYLSGYADLIAWARYVHILGEDEARRILADADRRPDDAAETFRDAIELRETIYRTFSAAAGGDNPDENDLDRLSRAYTDAMEHARLVPGDDRVAWSWDEDGSELDRMLWPVARSAVDLLTSDALHRVKECPGAEGPCTWLFLDTSKNAVRRWCSMTDGCGGVAKARRQTKRRRAES